MSKKIIIRNLIAGVILFLISLGIFIFRLNIAAAVFGSSHLAGYDDVPGCDIVNVNDQMTVQVIAIFAMVISGIIIAYYGFVFHRLSNSQSLSKDNSKCPFCAETIKAEAKICRFCGKEISNS